MKLLRKFALVWMFAWLPISGVMATTMPFCAQGMGGLAQAAMAADGMGTMPCHTSGDDMPVNEASLPIEHCDLCHIAGALVAPTLPFVANATPNISPFDAAASDFRSWVPDPLQHPPLPSPA